MLARVISSFVFVAALTGCSLLGAGIGSAVPRYEEAPAAARTLHVGDEIRVVLFEPASGRDSLPRAGGGEIDGRYAGIHDGMLEVTVDGMVEPRQIPLTDVMEIRTRKGSYWLAGLATGAFVDAALVTFVLVSIENSNPHFDMGSFK
jgi:hypothetical protein